MRVDCHCDTALWLLDRNSLLDVEEAHQDYQRISKYLDIAFMGIFVDENKHPDDAPRFFQNVFALLREDISAHRNIVCPLLYREDISAKYMAEGISIAHEKLLLIGAEGAAGLGVDCEYLDEYFAGGLRLIGPTWNYANQYAGGCGSESGFSQAGYDLIEKCNEKGILLDAAHLNKQSFWQMIEASNTPIIVSHTCCGGLYEHRRNIDDEQMQALAQKGGVMGITFVADFLGGAGDMARLCEHIEYAVELIGSEHVALGSDFDGCEPVEELAGVEKLPDIYAALAKRGMKQSDINNVAGESVVRLLMDVLPKK